MSTGTVIEQMPDAPIETSLARLERRVFGAIVVAGGASGLITSLSEPAQFSSARTFLVWLAFVAIYAAGVLIGLMRIENRRGAQRFLTVYMWLQVPVIQTYPLTYFFGSLLSLTLMYSGDTTFRWAYAPAGGWIFSLFTVNPGFGLGINAVPVCFLLALAILRKPR
jgi:hypothetical protein